MRRLARLAGRVVLGLVALVAVYLLAGTIGGAIPSGRTVPQDPGPPVAILLLPGPIHTDLMIPLTPEVRARFAPLAEDGIPVNAPEAEWLLVGWGAHDFYTRTRTWGDMRPGPVLRAITGDSAVMRLDVLPRIAADHGLTEVPLNPAQLTLLLDRIEADRGAVLPGDAFGPTDRFYDARGHFSVLRTCNTWVGEVLRGAGVPVGIWTPFTWTLP